MQAQPEEPSDVRWYFGSFVVWETQRRVERHSTTVRVGPRSFDLLLQLLKRPGEFVSKDELLASVWEGIVVEEASVRVHMSTLRKALGKPDASDNCHEWISNLPLRGYRFNGHAHREEARAVVKVRTWPIESTFIRPPVRLTEFIGREEDIERILTLLQNCRLLTIVGTGGIGKTSLAIRAAERYQLQHSVQTAFVDLSSIISPDHVVGALAHSVGTAADMPDAIHAITLALTDQDAVILIDNCEQVVETLAVVITDLLTALPRLRILATSREALRVSGEQVHRLMPLAVPKEDCDSLAEAITSPSVELLIARAKAAGAGTFSESHGAMLTKISRQLDGIPLAIELVAARLGVQSVSDLSRRLDDHMRLYSNSARFVLPRHKTLAAALDWSIALLTADELQLLRRLSVFRGRFDVESALRVTTGDMESDVGFDALISLANKSLISFDSSDAVAPYRLLDTTRSYAATQLSKSGEQEAILRRHAMFMLDVMKTASAEVPQLTESVWGERFAYRLDDVRFAVENCMTQLADVQTGAALTVASAPLWWHVSQVTGYSDMVSAVLKAVDREAEPNTEIATWLNTALITALLHIRGSNDQLDAVCDRALSGALAVKVPVLELRARWGRCTHDIFRGEYAAALRHSREMFDIVRSWNDAPALSLSHRVRSMATHFCGSFDESREHSISAISISERVGRSHANMVGPDPVVAAKAVLCRTLWIQGDTLGALGTAREALTIAESVGNPISLCAALYGACPVALWSNEIELASRWIPLMKEEAQRKGLQGWLRYAEWFSQGLALHTSRDPDLHRNEVAARFRDYDHPRREMLLTFCVDWIDDEMINRLSLGEGIWCAAEVLRAAGQRSQQSGNVSEAESQYLRSLAIAKGQGAFGWELRTTFSLATLWFTINQSKRAIAMIDEIKARTPLSHRSSAMRDLLSLHSQLLE